MKSTLDIGTGSSKGLHNLVNEDALYANAYKGIFVIADGIGGNAGGAEASHLVTMDVSTYLEDLLIEEELDEKSYEEKIRRMIKNVNQHLLKEMEKQNLPENMGSTLDLIAILNDRIYAGHVGDSRIALLKKDDSIETMMKSSSRKFLLESILDGDIDEEYAKMHLNSRHHISAWIGKRDLDDKDIDVASSSLEEISKIVMYTDGLSNISNDTLRDVLLQNQSSQLAVDELIDLAKNCPDQRIVDFYAEHRGISVQDAKKKLSAEDDMTIIVISPYDQKNDIRLQLSEKNRLIEQKQKEIEEQTKAYASDLDKKSQENKEVRMALSEKEREYIRLKRKNTVRKQRPSDANHQTEQSQKPKKVAKEKVAEQRSDLEKIAFDTADKVYETEKDVFENALSDYKSKKYSDSSKKFARLVESDTKNDLALDYYANSLANEGEWDESIKIFDAILLYDKTNTNALNYLGRIYLTKGKADKAIEYWSKGIENGCLYSMHNIEFFEEYCETEISFKDKEKLNFIRQKTNHYDLKLIDLVENAMVALKRYPYKSYKTNTSENAKVLYDIHNQLQRYCGLDSNDKATRELAQQVVENIQEVMKNDRTTIEDFCDNEYSADRLHYMSISEKKNIPRKVKHYRDITKIEKLDEVNK